MEKILALENFKHGNFSVEKGKVYSKEDLPMNLDDIYGYHSHGFFSITGLNDMPLQTVTTPVNPDDVIHEVE